MSKQLKVILLCLVFLALILGAVKLYPRLSAGYQPPSAAPAAEDAPAAEAPAAVQPQRDPAPDFTVQDGAGESVALMDFVGQPIVLNMWTSWCGPCRQELPAFDAAYAEYGDEVVFMMVNLTDGASETVEGVTAFVQEEGYSFPVYFDVDLSAMMAYNVLSIPTSVFIDAEGNIAGTRVGSLSAKDLQAQIERILDNSASN